jgi:hypothetical protein
MNIRSKEGAARVYATTLRRYMRDHAGGGMFGYDWRTLRINSPETYTRLCKLAILAKTLPSRFRTPA